MSTICGIILYTMTHYNPGLGASMTEWTTRLREAGLYEVAGQVDDDKLKTIQRLQELQLPTALTRVVNVAEFLRDQESHFKVVERPSYFAVLAPNDVNKKRYRISGAAKEDIRPFIEETLDASIFPEYSLILQEKLNYYYGGNIVCDTDDSVYAEMIEGSLGHNRLVSGVETPEFRASRDMFSGKFSYSFEDEDVRLALWKTISAIPKTYNEHHSPEYAARGLKFLPGYYEFYLTRRPETSPHEPIFIDYSDQPAFRVHS